MLMKIRQLLNETEIRRMLELSNQVRFVDGRVSNAANAAKKNLQVDTQDPKYNETSTIVGTALARSREFMEFALPKRIAPPMLCRYEAGMTYGAHADSALIVVNNQRIRSDVSCTVWIGDPRTYEGGELAIVVGNQTVAFKGEAGDAIVYPSTTLHEVVPVRSGQRLVSITFVESCVADAHQRAQLYELNEIAALEGTRMNWESRVRLDVVRQNLMRMWSQP